MSMPSTAPPGRAPILECVREGFAFISRDWRAILPVAAIGAAVLAPLEVWSEIAMTRGDMWASLLASLLTVFVQTPVLAAYFRRALSRGAAPLTLRAGGDERNIIGVTFALGFFFSIVLVVAFLLLGAALAALLAGSGADPQAWRDLPPEQAAAAFLAALGTDGKIVFVVLAVAVLAGFLWLSARLALALPATVAEGRMRVFTTWAWTRGNAAPIAACLLLVTIGALLISRLALIAPALLIGLTMGGETALQTPTSPGYWVFSYLVVFAWLVLFHAPFAAMSAYLYRGLKPA